jgi:hypothetical protein
MRDSVAIDDNVEPPGLGDRRAHRFRPCQGGTEPYGNLRLAGWSTPLI